MLRGLFFINSIMEICKNCGTEFEGNFCPNCGQRPNSGRIVFRESARDVLEHYFDFDAPLFRTIKGLITQPDKVIREYIFGMRKKYSHPFRYFILVLAVYLVIKTLTGFDPIQTFSEIVGAKETPDPNAIATKGSNLFSNHINTFLLIYAFTIALFSKIFNLRAQYHFVEHLALGFFIVAQYMFFSVFVTLASFISPYFFLTNYLLVFIYPMYVMVKFHDGNLFLRIIKAFFASVLAWISYAFLGFRISVEIVKIFGL